MFENLDADKTGLTMRMVFSPRKVRSQAVEFGAVEGDNQTLERLAGYLTAALN